jgi:hypothetical protein
MTKRSHTQQDVWPQGYAHVIPATQCCDNIPALVRTQSLLHREEDEHRCLLSAGGSSKTVEEQQTHSSIETSFNSSGVTQFPYPESRRDAFEESMRERRVRSLPSELVTSIQMLI